MEGEDGDFLSSILLQGQGVHVAGSEEMHVLDTQDSNFVEEVQGSRSSTKGGKGSKNFNREEDEQWRREGGAEGGLAPPTFP